MSWPTPWNYHVLLCSRHHPCFQIFPEHCSNFKETDYHVYDKLGIKLRRDEKKKLNDVNGDLTGRVRFHVKATNGKIKKRIQQNAEKIFLLINDALSGEPSTLDFTMNQVCSICMTQNAFFASSFWNLSFLDYLN